ncbi:unnamed protein product [Allacma fusca]|uniref:Centrosome-associated FAM110 C-terminal domain-containing protein n=1 Tax=Allacma fusca TaxID=39272 RepID=A0A8J2PYR8_9HEXA|nr:unnamed protein product [Allacma fusca]
MQGIEGSGKKDDNPPPLPPKSPRTTSKPVRPQDFPQRLPVQGMPPDIQPPPPPRRVMPHENDHYQESNIQSKLRRLLHDGPGGMTMQDTNLVPITLPSPILPPTPPPDVTLESPMSDSGPIISPPPAFSTPVTPMLDRQNSSASEKSSQRHHPLSAAMSMVSVSISSISSRNSRKSIPDLSDISMRYSPRSRSSSSPMSPDDADGEEEDDDSSAKVPISKVKISNANLQKKSTIPKSVTENALCKVSNLETAIPPRLTSHSSEVSPIRRPILRSKSDLSHRYIKSGSSSNLLGSGFTLVHVDLGLPPPPPPHQNSHYSPHIYYHGAKQPDAPEQCYQQQQQQQQQRSQESPNLGKKRCSKSSLELERFFDKLGLDNSTPPPAPSNNPGDRSGSSSPVFFSSVSSVDSGPRRGGSIDSGDSPLGMKVGSRTVGGGGYNAPVASTSGSTIVVQHGEPSIVERNARVIKWLFNCRKAVDRR